MSFSTVCILDHERNRTDLDTYEDALKYIYSYICNLCKDKVDLNKLDTVLETDCASSFWWIEDNDEI